MTCLIKEVERIRKLLMPIKVMEEVTAAFESILLRFLRLYCNLRSGDVYIYVYLFMYVLGHCWDLRLSSDKGLLSHVRTY